MTDEEDRDLYRRAAVDVEAAMLWAAKLAGYDNADDEVADLEIAARQGDQQAISRLVAWACARPRGRPPAPLASREVHANVHWTGRAGAARMSSRCVILGVPMHFVAYRVSVVDELQEPDPAYADEENAFAEAAEQGAAYETLSLYGSDYVVFGYPFKVDEVASRRIAVAQPEELRWSEELATGPEENLRARIRFTLHLGPGSGGTRVPVHVQCYQVVPDRRSEDGSQVRQAAVETGYPEDYEAFSEAATRLLPAGSRVGPWRTFTLAGRTYVPFASPFER